MEFTFLQFEVETVLSELLEDLRHVVTMFGQVPGVYEDVIDVHANEPMEELPEHLIHNGLEDWRWVWQPKRYNLVLIVAWWCDESHLLLIALPDTN